MVALYFTEVTSFTWELLHHLAMQITVALKNKTIVSRQQKTTPDHEANQCSGRPEAGDSQCLRLDHLSAWPFSTVLLKTGHSLSVRRTDWEYVVSRLRGSIPHDAEARKMVQVPCTQIDNQSCCSGMERGTPGLGTTHWRAENTAREKLCCCSTEPAGPGAAHLVEISRAAEGLGLHEQTRKGEQWSTSVWKPVHHRRSLSPRGCPG